MARNVLRATHPWYTGLVQTRPRDMASPKLNLHPDVRELILCRDGRYICETYIFEPSPAEEELGYLFAVAELEARDGVGRELIDMVISAVQREYYRDANRPVSTSFELALHQANLILHDSAEQGVRDWMGYFHVALGILAKDKLHISTAGEAAVFLVRKSRLVNVSTGLSHSPIVNPLQTFSQVATGVLAPRDTIFMGTQYFPDLFAKEDLTRFAVEHSAATIATRLQQLYGDQGSREPVAALTISLLPDYIREPEETVPARPSRAGAFIQQDHLRPRQPLILQRSWIKNLCIITGRLASYLWHQFRVLIWPYIRLGSQQGGRALLHVSTSTGRSIAGVATAQLRRLRSRSISSTLTAYRNIGQTQTEGSSTIQFSPPRLAIRSAARWPRQMWSSSTAWFSHLPQTSKMFAIITVVLIIALAVSLVLLQRKRAEDAQIQRASEILHETRTKKDAAQTALVYDNRDQARTLLTEAEQLLEQLRATGVYVEETSALAADVAAQHDRLQKIARPTTDAVTIVGDFGTAVAGATPDRLFLVDNRLYTYNPATNAIVSLEEGGQPRIATQTTQGIGFFTMGAVHTADKTVLLITDEPGLALLDTKDGTVLKQDIQFSSAQPDIQSASVFGSRLYVLERTSQNIFSYTKSLRGYSGGAAWISDADFPKDTIRSIAIDGNIYTLHTDGSIHRLFKGEEAEFQLEAVEPNLSSATALLTAEDMQYLYVLDAANRRVVILGKTGELVRQIFVDVAQNMKDIAISPDEKTLYILDGTRVLSVSLVE